VHRWRGYAAHRIGVPSVSDFPQKLREAKRGAHRGIKGSPQKKVERLEDALQSAAAFKSGHGSFLAGISLDDIRIRGSASFNSRITDNLLGVAEAWVEKDWRSTQINHGFMAGLKLQW
jgi:hypothetical protein